MVDTAEMAYRYPAPSALSGERLLLSTDGAHPRFFSGFAADPAVLAAGLMAVADVAGADHRRREPVYRDPIVTGHTDGLRFESFSGCCGVYARLDVESAGLDGELPEHGSTNVDVNPPLYTALSRVGAGDPVRLTVGPDELAVGTLDGVQVERRVPLPARWLRGLAEVPGATAAFDPRVTLSGAEAAALLRRLPAGRDVRWAVPAGRSLRLTGRAAPGAVCLAGPGRLATMLPLLRHARALTVYGPPVSAGAGPVASGWELDLGTARFTQVLSPEVYRGFSGEGGVLAALGADTAADDADRVRPLLGAEPVIDVGDVAAATGLPAARVRAALAVLGTAGTVGFDAGRLAWFHRELPFAPDLLAELNPRLAGARALVAAGAVGTGAGGFTVRSGEREYLVHRAGTDGALGCSCPWWVRHRGARGPCKHVLAVTLSTAGRA